MSTAMAFGQSNLCSGFRDSGVHDPLYEELWKACAGPLVEIPREGERVYYFPQGHMEQLEASTNEELNQKIHMFNLPSKILCRVMDIVLRAEKETDEVYAQITLMPEPNVRLDSDVISKFDMMIFTKYLPFWVAIIFWGGLNLPLLNLGGGVMWWSHVQQTEPGKPDSCKPKQPRPAVRSFSKVLTASDTSTHGGFSVLRKHANECLPPLVYSVSLYLRCLDVKFSSSVVVMPFVDHQISLSFVSQDMSQQTPTQELVALDLHGYVWRFKHIFRGQPRRHLLTTGWSHFVTSKRLAAGDSFVFLRGENEELRVGVRRVSHQQSSMPSSVISSQSMHLGVLATASHAVATNTYFVVYYKPRHAMMSQFVIGLNKYLESVKNSFTVGMRFKMKFEGEDTPERRFNGTIVGIEDYSPQWKNSRWRSLKVQWDEAASIPRPDRVSGWEIEPLGSCPSSDVVDPVKSKKARPSIGVPGHDSMSVIDSTPWNASLNTAKGEFEDSKATTVWSVFSSYVTPKMANQRNDLTENKKKSEAVASCRLFGIDLMKPSTPAPKEEDIVQEVKVNNISVEEHGPSSEATTDSEQKSDLSKLSQEKKQSLPLVSPKETQSKLGPSTRTRTKVQMQGVAVGRAVDLTMLEGYQQLIDELERLFDMEGELHPRDKWEIAFTDDEGDMMLVGDDPWEEFCNMAKRIYICSRQEVKKMSPGSKLLPLSSSLTLVGDGTVFSLESSGH
ncbi:hypothetical protein Cgig2_031479 [Carnegiea gigantea]|uniref:Auxin response factor n=1 Tax=Carnegiea gigantea TaxID=171969 RepID=A0A9Q1K4C5_9CARY|nr:hypothetical protein Cgig2_031479 [Carnegiea gigantea]